MTSTARSAASSTLRWLEAHRWASLSLVLLVTVGIHLISAAVTIRHSNQDPVASDQGAEMWLAATAQEDFLPQRTDGVRHPLWSWIVRFLYTEDKGAFFERGKWLNTIICIAFLCGLGIAVAPWLDALAAANLLLLSSLGILLVRGTYFQPEPTYYILLFLAIILAWKILRGASFWIYVVFGITCGLAYLAKPSLAPFLIVFSGAIALRCLLTLRAQSRRWSISQNLAGVVIAFGIVAVMVVPLAIFSAKHFGTPLFNYTKYWMWMDDFMTEAWPFQDRYPGRVQLQQLPKEERPSAAWYLQRHGIGDAAGRLTNGSREVFMRFFFPEPKVPPSAMIWRSAVKKWEQPLAHRGVYLLVLAALCVFLASASRTQTLDALRDPANISCLAFAGALVMVYLLLYGWYWPIGRGDRFMGSLWIPSVFGLVWAAWRLRSRLATPFGDVAYVIGHAVILISLALQIVGILWRFSAGIYLVTRN